MKRFFTFSLALLAVMGILSCTKNQKAVQDVKPAETLSVPEGSGILNISLEDPQTKAQLSSVQPNQVNTLQVFIFDSESGEKETDKFISDGSTSTSITSLVGEKNVWVAVNHEKIQAECLEDFINTVSYLKDNSFSNFHMTGNNDGVEVTPLDPVNNPNGNNITVPVYRVASQICLQKVKVNFTGTALEGFTFTIKSLYLKNVVGASYMDRYTALLSTPYWYNKMEFESSDAAVLVSDMNMNPGISCPTNGTEVTVNRSYYAYPNPTTNDTNSAQWSVRHTRLIMRATVKGMYYGNQREYDTYYVFTLPKLVNNHTYDITSVNITMLGKDNDDDDTDTVTGKANVTIQVNGWSESTNLTYNI
ncbi:MAG: hypothetical protein J6X99_01215 [Bacteroidales bacterium]|nr:hypothetical protein [Bacteroidales bacterium]